MMPAYCTVTRQRTDADGCRCISFFHVYTDDQGEAEAVIDQVYASVHMQNGRVQRGDVWIGYTLADETRIHPAGQPGRARL